MQSIFNHVLKLLGINQEITGGQDSSPRSGSGPDSHLLEIFSPIDSIEPSRLSAYLQCSPSLTEFSLLYPPDMRTKIVEFPIVLYGEVCTDLLMRRVYQTLLATRGLVHVILGVGQVLKTDDERVRIWPNSDTNSTSDICALLDTILESSDSPLVGLWELSVEPTSAAWHFLNSAIQLRQDLAFVGASLVNSDGFTEDDASAISRDAAERHQLVYFYDPIRFRLNTTPRAEVRLGVARTSAVLSMLNALKSARQLDDSITSNLYLPEHSHIGIQGCAVALTHNHVKGFGSSNWFLSLIDPAPPNIQSPEGIFFVDSVPPAPDRDAGSVTADNFISICLDRGADVLFASTSDRSWSNVYNLAISARGVICLTEPFYRDTAAIAEFIRAQKYSTLTIVLSRVHAGGEFQEMIRTEFPFAKIIFNTVDLHGLRELREAKLVGSDARSFSANATLSRERDLVQRADATIILSETELKELEPYARYANVRLIPLVSEFRMPTKSFDERHDIMFIGSYSHQPNVDAVEYIFDELWPMVQTKDPSMVLKLVGPNFPSQLAGRLPRGVQLLGYVENLSEELESTRITIAPLRYGAGIKGKVAMSLSHGVPCVASSVAVEGMGLVDERDVLVADSAHGFVQSLLRIYHNKILWQDLSSKGYQFCESRYSRTAVAKQLNALIDELQADKGFND